MFEDAASDGGGAGASPDGDRILADVLEPDVADGAGTLAVDSLVLIGADHDVPGECMRQYSRKNGCIEAIR